VGPSETKLESLLAALGVNFPSLVGQTEAVGAMDVEFFDEGTGEEVRGQTGRVEGFAGQGTPTRGRALSGVMVCDERGVKVGVSVLLSVRVGSGVWRRERGSGARPNDKNVPTDTVFAETVAEGCDDRVNHDAETDGAHDLPGWGVHKHVDVGVVGAQGLRVNVTPAEEDAHRGWTAIRRRRHNK
jgi:hypothetical protein